MSLAFCAPLFEQPAALAPYDWDQHLFLRAAVLKSVVEYAELPFWNPWYCGGNVLWQNPQVALLSPTYLFAAFMPLALAMKVDILLHYWIGLAGMHVLLTRGIGLTSRPIAIFLSSTFGLSGALALHLVNGHSNFLPAFYLPVLLLAFLRALDTGAIRHALLGGAIVAVIIYNGGLHVLPMAFIAVGSMGVFAAGLRRRFQPLLLAIVLVLSGLGYAAPKLVPVAAFATSDRLIDRRPSDSDDYVTAEMFVRAYLDRNQHNGYELTDQPYDWHEYGNYVGLFAALAAVVSVGFALAWARGPDAWLGRTLALSTLLAMSLAAGEFAEMSPAALLRNLPFFAFFRLPSRHTVWFVLLATMTIAWAARALEERIHAVRWAGWLTVFVCGLATLDLLVVNRAHFRGVFSQPPLARGFTLLARPPAPVVDARTQGRDRRSSPMLRALMSGGAVLQCYEPLQLRRTADPRQALVYTDSTDRALQLAAFSPNRVEFTVSDGAEAVRVFLNQNYADGWTSSAGPVTRDQRERKGAVVVHGPKGGRFAFVFVPPGIWWGIFTFVLAAAGSRPLWRRQLACRDAPHDAARGASR